MLQHISFYKPNYEQLCEKILKSVHDANRGVGGNNIFLVGVVGDEAKGETSLDLTQFGGFEDEAEIHRFIDLQVERLETNWALQQRIDDDSIPNLSFNMGIGEYAAFVGGEIEFTVETSWTHPILEELSDYKNLPPLGEAKWFKRYMYMMELFLQKTAHTEAPLGRGFYSPLDLANALVGDRLYTDFYDDPEGVAELMDYCADAIIFFAKAIYALAEKYLGHTKYGMMYLRENINMSEDIATNISGAMYQEHCARHTQKVIDAFGKGYMHTHTCAVYLVKEICNLNNAPYMWLVTDPNATRAIDIVSQLTEDSNYTHLAIDAQVIEDVEKAYPELVKGNYSVWLPAETVAKAQEIVKRYRALQATTQAAL